MSLKEKRVERGREREKAEEMEVEKPSQAISIE